MNKVYRNETEKLIWKLCGLVILSVIFYLEGYYLTAVNTMGGGGSLAVLVNFNAISSIIAIWVVIFNFKGKKNIDKILKALFYSVIIISPIFVLTNLFGGGWILLFIIIKQYKKRDSKELI